MKLPLTLAIIDGLVVGVGAQRYIVPIFAVREMLKPARGRHFDLAGPRGDGAGAGHAAAAGPPASALSG